MLETMERSGSEAYQLTEDERALIQVGLDEAERGEFVSDADMQAFWDRHRK